MFSVLLITLIGYPWSAKGPLFLPAVGWPGVAAWLAFPKKLLPEVR
jgi:hypothetical protein